MSISIRIAAQRALTEKDLELVSVFNKLCDAGIGAPGELIKRLSAALGEKVYSLEPIAMNTDLIETYIEGNDVMYGDGMTIKISDLPTGTVALRIYAT